MTRSATARLAVLALVFGFVGGLAGWALLGERVAPVPTAVAEELAPSGVASPVAAGLAVASPSPSVASPSPAPPSAVPSAVPSAAPSPAASPAPSASPAATPAPSYRGPTTRTVPVLMYHRIADPAPGAPYPGLYVSPAAFAAQMQALRAAGWRTITAGELGAAMAANRPVPARTIVIMFDDGYADNYLAAFPVLRRLGFRATFSVVARGGSTMMTSQQLATMERAGMEIGNHTLDHKNIASLGPAELVRQIEGGALRIEARLASQGVIVNPRTFVYPSGHVGPAALALLRRLGYTDAFTEVPGFAVIGRTSPLLIPRVRVSRFESLAAFLGSLPVQPRP